jgi:hypothetical protein
MTNSTALQMERLEERAVPALFGVPWADARNLTLSFVPDGTSVDGVESTLFSTFQQPATAAWQAEILRAVQTWAQYANINVSVVADSGDAVGVDGANQADPRFGDIRIAARPLSGDVLAITSPSGPLAGTRAGDIVINTNALFSIGGTKGTYDLYSAMLQEIGHALGLGNSTDPDSPLFETYSGVRTGLTSGDISSIRTLYGSRAGDGFEGYSSSGSSSSSAFTVRAPSGSPAGASPVLVADLTNAQDVDYYRFLTPSTGNTLIVQVDTSSSLLAARLTVYDNQGNVVGTAVGTPQGRVLQVTVNGAKKNAYYTARVEAATPTFAVGSYQLRFATNPNAPDVMAYGSATLLDDSHRNDTRGEATQLYTASGYAYRTHYSALARVRDAEDVDFYRIETPWASSNQQLVLTINIRAIEPETLNPAVQVYDKDGRLVDVQVINDGHGTLTLQLANARKFSRYYLGVGTANAGETGNYQLDVDIRTQAINLQSFAAGELSTETAVDYRTLTTSRSQVMYLELSAGALPAGVLGGVRMAVFDNLGRVVASLIALAGQTVSTNTYLTAGSYMVRFEALAPTGTILPDLTYGLKGVTLTDPIATAPSDPTLLPPAADYSFTRDAHSFYAALPNDLLGDVIW